MRKFQAINTVLNNLKTAMAGTYHAVKFNKYARRYLAEVQYRFNRRFDLRSIRGWCGLRLAPSRISGASFVRLRLVANQVDVSHVSAPVLLCDTTCLCPPLARNCDAGAMVGRWWADTEQPRPPSNRASHVARGQEGGVLRHS